MNKYFNNWYKGTNAWEDVYGPNGSLEKLSNKEKFTTPCTTFGEGDVVDSLPAEKTNE